MMWMAAADEVENDDDDVDDDDIDSDPHQRRFHSQHHHRVRVSCCLDYLRMLCKLRSIGNNHFQNSLKTISLWPDVTKFRH